ncbi:hypothetical protein [uncultured Nitratireductor sp.]|uniref:dCTP deaminase domain-containing protein n=1 Tax=uncultured Nitratireductor sp. TaxID=520953 RepID=UPI0025CE081B|nr:hypothetical protein [uncultured Nitratireductor sp.]
MTLLAADALDPKRFFKDGSNPVVQGSSFDLTVGCIFDHEGKKVSGPFTLKPGHMVQVASAEVFSLPTDVTGHVTYKTSLTSRGIWALTVGIVDPGWDGPIATTLLNYSRVDHPISEGDSFLRVSFFQHDSVDDRKLRKVPQPTPYLKKLQAAAATIFPQTFLDSSRIAEQAGETAVRRMQNRGLIWVTGIAFLFAIIQLVTAYLSPSVILDERVAKSEFEVLQAELMSLKSRLGELERGNEATAESNMPPQPSEQRQPTSPSPATSGEGDTPK